MFTRPTCRNSRRPLYVIAAVAGLGYFYISCYCGAHWLLGRRLITPRTYELLNESVFYPARIYAYANWPGSRTLQIASTWCMFNGAGTEITWDGAAGWVEPSNP
ncbi:MAG: hypothetical protein JNG89_00135 [Planctomycetaceae bacterium]|nr:hypothetical protein [Planctomycetaceae bacterium]